jgi:hypothetical protein
MFGNKVNKVFIISYDLIHNFDLNSITIVY